mgnify:CR=1 FL=1
MNETVLFALLIDLWRDLHEPAFLWQVLALALSLLFAGALSRYWRKQDFARASSDHGRLRLFGTGSLKRVAFPLLALLLVLIVRKLFRVSHFGPVSLFDLTIPLLLSMALVRAAIYVLRHALAPGSWLATSERLIATSIWLCLALYLTGLADPIIDTLEQVSFHLGKQKLDLWTLLNGLVIVVATVLVALWLSGVVERRLLASENLDSNIRVVLGRLVKAVLSVVAWTSWMNSSTRPDATAEAGLALSSASMSTAERASRVWSCAARSTRLRTFSAAFPVSREM